MIWRILIETKISKRERYKLQLCILLVKQTSDGYLLIILTLLFILIIEKNFFKSISRYIYISVIIISDNNPIKSNKTEMLLFKSQPDLPN